MMAHEAGGKVAHGNIAVFYITMALKVEKH